MGEKSRHPQIYSLGTGMDSGEGGQDCGGGYGNDDELCLGKLW